MKFFASKTAALSAAMDALKEDFATCESSCRARERRRLERQFALDSRIWQRLDKLQDNIGTLGVWMTEIFSRLDEVEKRLAALAPENGNPSSTTRILPFKNAGEE